MSGIGVGVMALEDGARVDFTRLRSERRRTLLAAMAEAGLDALVLGRSANVRYAAGARTLWRTGANPFGPVCVVVRRTGKVHLLSSWDDGIPPEIGHEDLYGLFWNPAHLIAGIAAIPGLGEAARVGTDAVTPFFAQVLPQIAPGAELADASALLERARAHKTDDELGCIATALALAEAGLGALEAALEPGVSERALLGVYVEAVSRLGAPTPPSENVVFATPRQGPVRYRYLARDRLIGKGELVVLSPGALYAGYEAGLGRTRTAGAAPSARAVALGDRARRAADALIGACRAGHTGADLYRAWEGAGEPTPEIALAYGVGLGAESPMIGFGRGAGSPLEEGAVLCVQAWVSEEGTGGHFERELLRVGPSGPEVLSRSER
jgi:Xaa-Pro aminopeptidase